MTPIEKLRYTAWTVFVYWPRLTRATAVWLVESAGYWIRPYDMLADARRWRWQPRAKCGRQAFAEMPEELRLALIAYADEIAAKGGDA